MTHRPTPTRTSTTAAALSLATAILCLSAAHAQTADHRQIEVTAHLQLSTAHPANLPAAVLWLKPITPGLAILPFVPPRTGYTLLQKDKMFSPHLLVIPTGSVVMFPNADPFFHNVFSLFDGKRFDLGLYEAGKTKAVTFSRDGISYIFCNIHSQMSAVILALPTSLYSIAEPDGTFHVANVPDGEYEMHLWVEGEQQPILDRWVRRIKISAANRNLGPIVLDHAPQNLKHDNKFGQPYDQPRKTIY